LATASAVARRQPSLRQWLPQLSARTALRGTAPALGSASGEKSRAIRWRT